MRSEWYQVPEEQIREIIEFCRDQKLKITKIFNDTDQRKKYELSHYLQSGDILIVTNIEALGTDPNEIINELVNYRKQGVRVINLEVPETTKFYDHSDIADKLADMYIDMYASMIKAGRKKRKMAQQVGLERKRRQGKNNTGRPKSIPKELFLECYKRCENGDVSVKEAMELCGIKKSTWYKYCKEYDEEIKKSFPHKKGT